MRNIDKLDTTDLAFNGSPEYVRVVLDDLVSLIKLQRKLAEEVLRFHPENLERIKILAANIVWES